VDFFIHRLVSLPKHGAALRVTNDDVLAQVNEHCCGNFARESTFGFPMHILRTYLDVAAFGLFLGSL